MYWVFTKRESNLTSSPFNQQCLPFDQRLCDSGFSAISSFMARESINDLYDGVEAFFRGLYHHLNNRAMNVDASYDDFVNERIAVKAKRFNPIINNQIAKDEALDREAYRKASDGE